LALEFALEANEMTEFTDPQSLKTLALAYHRIGEKEKALETLERAIALLPEGDVRTRLETKLVEFEAEATR